MPTEKKKGHENGQDLLFVLPTAESELRINPRTGKPIPRHHEPQRTQLEIHQAHLNRPVPTIIKDGDPVVQGQG